MSTDVINLIERAKKCDQLSKDFGSKYRSLLREAQELCEHPSEDILEGEFKPEGLIFNAEPPFRVCKICSYAEEGWGCGYNKLKYLYDTPIAKMKRVDALKYVLLGINRT